MPSKQSERLEAALIDGICKAIEEKDYRAIEAMSAQLENLRRGAPKAHERSLSIKEAAAILGLSYQKMLYLADHVAMRGAVYVTNPGGKNKRRRVDITKARRLLTSMPAGSY